MIRAVLDTNILLSALRSRVGASHEILSRLVKREFELIIGNTVLAEYDEVLKHECPSFGVPVATVNPGPTHLKIEKAEEVAVIP